MRSVGSPWMKPLGLSAGIISSRSLESSVFCDNSVSVDLLAWGGGLFLPGVALLVVGVDLPPVVGVDLPEVGVDLPVVDVALAVFGVAFPISFLSLVPAFASGVDDDELTLAFLADDGRGMLIRREVSTMVI